MAIADVYDALISRRVYKPPMRHKKAVDIIAAGRDRHFDPDMVDGFLKLQEKFREIALSFVDSDEEREALQQD
jgi:putative two-component system response regulator